MKIMHKKSTKDIIKCIFVILMALVFTATLLVGVKTWDGGLDDAVASLYSGDYLLGFIGYERVGDAPYASVVFYFKTYYIVYVPIALAFLLWLFRILNSSKVTYMIVACVTSFIVLTIESFIISNSFELIYGALWIQIIRFMGFSFFIYLCLSAVNRLYNPIFNIVNENIGIGNE